MQCLGLNRGFRGQNPANSPLRCCTVKIYFLFFSGSLSRLFSDVKINSTASICVQSIYRKTNQIQNLRIKKLKQIHKANCALTQTNRHKMVQVPVPVHSCYFISLYFILRSYQTGVQIFSTKFRAHFKTIGAKKINMKHVRH